MITQTIIVALLFGILALSRRSPGSALGVVIMSMMLWPEYLRFPLGLAEMSVPRILAVALLFQFMAKGHHRELNFGKIDLIVLVIWIWTILATVIAGGAAAQITQMIGRGLDTVLMYFVARIAVRSTVDVRGLCASLMIIAMAMSIVGVVETMTSRSPYSSMTDYMVWTSEFDKDDEYRLDFLRAKGSTATHIYFGMAMMVILGMCMAIRGYFGKPFLYRITVLAALLASLSSMSSGPWLGCIMVFIFYGFSRRVLWIRPAIYLILLAFAMMELLSNRHFYHLIDYIALDPATAWYRTRLLEVAVSQWGDIGIFGVGSNWPHHWSALVDGRKHIDVVNHFLIVALYGGTPALIMYITTHVSAVRSAARAWRVDQDEARRRWLFGLAATLIALDFSSMSVGLFGPVLLLSHILLGSLQSSAVAWRKPTGVPKKDGTVLVL